MTPQPPQVGPDPSARWRLLAVLGVGELLAMSPWFSASAVAPLITVQLNLSGLDLPLLTIAVQLGFVVGALLIAVTGAADVLPARVAVPGRRHRGRRRQPRVRLRRR